MADPTGRSTKTPVSPRRTRSTIATSGTFLAFAASLRAVQGILHQWSATAVTATGPVVRPGRHAPEVSHRGTASSCGTLSAGALALHRQRGNQSEHWGL